MIQVGSRAEDGPREERVLAAGELGMEPSANFEQRANTAVNLYPARGRGRPRDSRQYLQQSGLARATPADQTKDYAFAHFERYVLQVPESLFLFPAKESKR